MGARKAYRSVRPRAAVGAAVLGLAVAGAGCGEDDFPNEPRAAAPISVTAKVDPKKVVVSPREFGAGLVNFTVSNQSDDVIRLTLVGPGPEDNAESGEVPPNGVGSLKAEMSEGDYEISAGERSDAQPAQVTVGPARETSQNDLLLP